MATYSKITTEYHDTLLSRASELTDGFTKPLNKTAAVSAVSGEIRASGQSVATELERLVLAAQGKMFASDAGKVSEKAAVAYYNKRRQALARHGITLSGRSVTARSLSSIELVKGQSRHHKGNTGPKGYIGKKVISF